MASRRNPESALRRELDDLQGAVDDALDALRDGKISQAVEILADFAGEEGEQDDEDAD